MSTCRSTTFLLSGERMEALIDSKLEVDMSWVTLACVGSL